MTMMFTFYFRFPHRIGLHPGRRGYANENRDVHVRAGIATTDMGRSTLSSSGTGDQRTHRTGELSEIS